MRTAVAVVLAVCAACSSTNSTGAAAFEGMWVCTGTFSAIGATSAYDQSWVISATGADTISIDVVTGDAGTGTSCTIACTVSGTTATISSGATCGSGYVLKTGTASLSGSVLSATSAGTLDGVAATTTSNCIKG